MPAILHIGSPKTGTTALQTDVIPHLGLPYQIKPAWSRTLSRQHEFERPTDLPENLILSDEMLGEFATFPPKVIASRLGAIFKDAHVIFTVREPVSLFLSLYRQQVINIMANQQKIFRTLGRYGSYLSPDEVFDGTLEDYRVNGRGLLAMTNVAGLRAVFGRGFRLTLLAYEDLQRDPSAYAEQFCKACGVAKVEIVSKTNVSSQETFEATFNELPPGFPPPLLALFRSQYESPVLSPDRIAFLRKWTEPFVPFTG